MADVISYSGSDKWKKRATELLNQGGGGGGTSDYTDLTNKPKINNVELSGNKTTSDLGIVIPTKVSDLQNDTGFITSTVNNLTNYYLKTETYTKAEVDALIEAVSTLTIEVVQVLPTHDISTTTIYLVPKATAGTQDVYDEYIYVNNDWEHIGSTEVDLSNYYTKTQVDSLLSGKSDKQNFTGGRLLQSVAGGTFAELGFTMGIDGTDGGLNITVYGGA